MSDQASPKENSQQEVQVEDEGYTQALLICVGFFCVMFMFLFYLINPYIPVDSSGLFSDTLWISIPLGMLLIGKIWQFLGEIWESSSFLDSIQVRRFCFLDDLIELIQFCIFCALVFFNFPFYTVRFINGIADTSMPQVREVLVIDKYSSPSSKYTNNSRDRNYLVKFQFENQPLEFIYANSESSSLRKKKFNQIAVGKSKIEISIHEGFLGYPWYEVKRVVL
jgi:hypothetical protein